MSPRTRKIVLRVLVGATVVALASACVADLRRPPSQQFASRTAIAAIRWYQVRLSGHLGVRCRFVPTCSQYAAVVIARHGIVGGGWRAVKRIVRCGPWTPKGTVDLPD
jgi:hypothetical protein